MRRERWSKARMTRHRENENIVRDMSPEERATAVVIGFISAIIGLALEALWLGWLGVVVVRVIRRRRSGMVRAVRDGIRLPDLIGMAVIQVVFWRFRQILRGFMFWLPAAEEDES